MRLIALAVFALAVVAATPASAQTASAPAVRDAVSRWRALPEAERDRLRKVYDDFKKLPKQEQDALRARAKESAKERERFENRLTPQEREALQALGPDARDQFLRGVLRELLTGRFRGKPLVGRDKLREVLTLPVEKRRDALKELLEVAGRKSIDQTLETAMKKGVIVGEEKARIEALPLREAASETLAVRMRLVVAKLEESPDARPFHDAAEWEKAKSLPPERFFERLEAARALHGAPKAGPSGEGPASKRGHAWEEATRARAKAYFVSLGVAPDEAERLAAERPIFKVFETASRLRAEKGGTAPPFDEGRRARGR